MTLRRNILVSYASQFYVTGVGILILPMYLKTMGAEAYGLVSFFALMQSWFNLLDIGLTPTVARETARFRGGLVRPSDYLLLLRLLQIFFFVTAVVAGCILISFSGYIADDWLNVQILPREQVVLTLKLIAICVAMRWISGLYRACISGAEELAWLGGFNATFATLRFVGVLPILFFISASPISFFIYQLIVAIFEAFTLFLKTASLMPNAPTPLWRNWTMRSFLADRTSLIKFSLSVAFTSSVWVMITQVDKLILSKLLPLGEYGYFTLAVLAATGVMLLNGPITSAILPRMSRIAAEGKEDDLINLYRSATQMIAMITVPVCLVLACFAEKVLWVWTGDTYIASQAGPILSLYAVGNGFLALSALPYYLQYAKGDLKLHLIGNVVYLILLVPLIIICTLRYGAIGAGYAWLSLNGAYLICWSPIVHRRLAKGLHWDWLFRDLLSISMPGILCALVFYKYISWPNDRLDALFMLAAFCLSVGFCSCAGSSLFRNRFKSRVSTIFSYKI